MAMEPNEQSEADLRNRPAVVRRSTMIAAVVLALAIGAVAGRSSVDDSSAVVKTVETTSGESNASASSTTSPQVAVSIDDAKNLIEQGKFDEAKTILMGILQVDPANQVVLYNLGVISTQSQEPAAAIDWYTKALAVEPAMHSAVYNRGLAYLAMDDAASAIKDLEQAATLAPDWAKGKFYLGKAYVAGGQAEKGQQLIADAQAADPSLKG